MLERIVLTTDFSDLARTAYEAAAILAKKHGSKIDLVHQAEPPSPLFYEHVGVELPMAKYFDGVEKRLAEEREHESLEGLDVRTVLLSARHEHDTLVSYAEAERPDLILLSTHGRGGVSRALLGSFTENVVRRSPVPVLTYRHEEGQVAKTPSRVLVPFDFSENSRAVLPMVRALGTLFGTRLCLLHVLPNVDEFFYGRFSVETPPDDEPVKRSSPAVRKTIERLEKVAHAELADLDVDVVVSEGYEYPEIVKAAEEIDANLIVMATHGRTGLKHFFLGSVAEKVVRRAPCSVLTVRPEVVIEEQAKNPAFSVDTAF